MELALKNKPKENTTNKFKAMTSQQRQTHYEYYLKNICIEKGKTNFKGSRMPWMLDSWEHKLDLLTRVMREKKEIQ